MIVLDAPAHVAPSEVAAAADRTEQLMHAVQAGGLGAWRESDWLVLEAQLGRIIDSAIASVPNVARRLVGAFQRLGWLVRAPLGHADAETQVVDDLETVLECLAAYEEGIPVGADRTPAELLLWLATTLGLSQAQTAALLAVSLRTLQRWLRGEARTGADDITRIRRLARAVNEARFALTPQGVRAWLTRPSAYAGGASPAEVVLSEDPDADALLERLAATLRYA